MRIIDRYVIREVLLPLCIGLLVVTFLLIIPFLIEYAEDFIAKGVPFGTVLQVMMTLLPQALALAIPSSVLVSLLVAFGRLSSDREFVAMQACGIGLARLMRPVAIVSLLGWGATSYVMIEALPNANLRFQELRFSIISARAEGEVKARVFFTEFPNLALYVRDIPATGGWNDVFMSDTRPGQTPATYVARHGRVILDAGKRRVEMLLEDGARHSVDAAGDYDVAQFQRLVLSVDPETIFPRNGPAKGDNEMTIGELEARARQLEAAGESSHNQLMAIHRKFSIPVACLVFGLIGLALGATNRRDGKMGSWVFGFAVIFVYYIPLFLGPALAKAGWVPPWFAVWLPNLLLGGVGTFMLLRRARAADQPLMTPLLLLLRRLMPARAAAADAPAGRPAAATPPRGVGSILDRYVAANYTRVFSIATLGLTGLFYVSTFVDLSDKVFKGQATWAMMGQFFWYIAPQYVYYVLPMAVLLATLVTIGLLTKNSELIVMKACGISLYRVAAPMLVGALTAAVVLFVLDQSILGPANRRAETLNRIMRGRAPGGPDIANRQWIAGQDGRIYRYDYFDASARRLLNLTVYTLEDKGRIASRTFAERVVYSGEQAGWQAELGWRRSFAETGDVTTFDAFQSTLLSLEPVATFEAQQPDPRFMSYTELRRYVALLQTSGFDVGELQVALERKLAFPFITLIMTLIAIPFAVTTGRRGAMYGVGVGIVLALSYWVAISVFAALGSGGVVAPLVAAWAPNFLFGAGAAYLLLTVRT